MNSRHKEGKRLVVQGDPCGRPCNRQEADSHQGRGDPCGRPGKNSLIAYIFIKWYNPNWRSGEWDVP